MAAGELVATQVPGNPHPWYKGAGSKLTHERRPEQFGASAEHPRPPSLGDTRPTLL